MSKNLANIIIAHRGESFIAPENTLSAINMAWDLGVKAIEIDVQLTLDHKIVVIHDRSTKRVGNTNKCIRKSLLKDLKRVEVGLFKDKRWKGETIPTLQEVIETIPLDGKLIIEIKSTDEIINPLCALLKSINIDDSQIEIISFNRKVLAKIKKRLPQYKMLWLLNLDYYLPSYLILFNTKSILRKVANGNFDGVNVWAGRILNKKLVRLFNENNLLVYTWTINDIKSAKKLLALGVDGITTDRSSWLSKQLKQ